MLFFVNSNVTTELVQLHNFLSQTIGGTKYIVCLSLPKSWGSMPSEIRSLAPGVIFRRLGDLHQK